jgi:hypothetical protein
MPYNTMATEAPYQLFQEIMMKKKPLDKKDERTPLSPE